MAKDDDPKAELFACYKRGWQHGATARARDKRFSEHATREDIQREYLLGYTRGFDCRMVEMARRCEQTGYDPRLSILRAPVAEDG
jgi:hypothetical protein